MRRSLGAAFAALAVAAGCASLFHKPRPDADLPVAERPWRVRCRWVEPPPADPAAPPGARASGTLWAGDAEERRLILGGRLEDGFFVADAVRAASDRDDRDVVPLPATAAAVKQHCEGAVARALPAVPRLLYTMRAARDGEGVDVPLVFPSDAARPRPASRIVVFGDSLSDAGNLKERLLVFPNAPYWFGHFTNGPNWTDYLAERTGLAIANYAYGGAAAVKHDDVPTDDVIAAIEQGAQFFLTGSLDGQVRDYVERDLAGGAVQSPDETVYVLWGGANDYITKEPFSGDFRTLLDTPTGQAGYRRVVEEAVAALADQVRTLHRAGGRHFVLLNLPDLGRTPIVLHNTSYEPADVPAQLGDEARRLRLAKKLGELIGYHNAKLRRAAENLERELPGAKVQRIDAAKTIELLLESREPGRSRRAFDYGFDLDARRGVLHDARQVRYRIQDRCYEGGYLGSQDPEQVCEKANRVMFWDQVHPTSFTHCWIAWFVQRELARAALAEEPPPPADYRAYCLGKAAPADASAPAASLPVVR